MADNKDSKKRAPDIPEVDYQYLHCVYQFQDRSGLYIHEKNGKNFVVMLDGVGGYTCINQNGDKQSFEVGFGHNYNRSGVTMTVDHNGDVKLAGHNRILMGGGGHIEVTGDAGIAVGGDTAIVGMGKINARAKSVYIGSDGDVAVHASGNMEIKAGGTMHLKASQIRHNSSGGFSS